MELFWRALLTENILMFKFLGIYLLLRFTGTAGEAARMGAMVAGGMILASWLGWIIDVHVLVPAGLEALRGWAFVLVVLVVALVIARIAGRREGELWQSGLLNTAALGLLLINAGAGTNPLAMFLTSAGSALGVLLVLVVVGSIMGATETTYVPAPLRGAPIRLMVMGVLALAFMGFRFPL